MMARSSKAPSTGRIQKRKTNFFKSSFSACNARPVHTEGPTRDITASSSLSSDRCNLMSQLSRDVPNAIIAMGNAVLSASVS